MLGALLGAAGSLASTLLGRSDAKRQEQNQREFAQQGIQWKVADAKKAGIHPLYALGANTTSYAPVSVGDSSHLASMGQDVGRAIDATRTTSQRVTAFDQTMQQLSLQRAGLENDLLASQIAKTKLQIGPPMAGDNYEIPGQTSSGLEKTSKAQNTPVLRAFGRGLYDTGNFSDAQSFEDVGGEGAGDWAAGPLNILDRIRVSQSTLPLYQSFIQYKAKGGTASVKDFARANPQLWRK